MLKYSFVKQDAEEARPYSYEYQVKDEESRNDYEKNESSDGTTVTGSYRVLLHDSRVQVVTYTAGPDGFVAQVTYEGEAKYPEPAAAAAAASKGPESYTPAKSGY